MSLVCSMRLVLIVTVALQVIIGSCVTWIIYYTGQISLVQGVSSELRQQTQSHANDQVSQLLSVPVSALNELDANAALRLVYSVNDFESRFDFSRDSLFYTILANNLRRYPGISKSGMMTAGGSLLVGSLDFRQDPPPLFFHQQDAQTNWNSTGFVMNQYNQTLTWQQLYSDLSMSSSTNIFMDSIPIKWIRDGRSNIEWSDPTIEPESIPWYNLCYETSEQSIRQQQITRDKVGWLLPSISIEDSVETSSIILCKPHINWNPNPASLLEVARQAQQLNDSRSALLFDRAHQAYNASLYNLSYPILNYVTMVTYSTQAMHSFLSKRLNDYVVNDGGAFIVSTDGYLLASTFDDLGIGYVKSCLKQKHNISDSTCEYLENVCLHLSGSGFQFNFEDPNEQSTEQVEKINGRKFYLQLSLLGSNNKSMRFILFMYSNHSAYNGNLDYNLMVMGIITGITIVLTVLGTSMITACVVSPIGKLVSAMQAIVDAHNTDSISIGVNIPHKDQNQSKHSMENQNHLFSIRKNVRRLSKASSELQPLNIRHESTKSDFDYSPSNDPLLKSIKSEAPILSSQELESQLIQWCNIMDNQSLYVPEEWRCDNHQEFPHESNPSRWWSSLTRFLHEVIEVETTFGWLLYRLKVSQKRIEEVNGSLNASQSKLETINHTLQQSQSKLEVSVAAKQNFVRWVFHEVRVPMNAIGMAVNALSMLINEHLIGFPPTEDDLGPVKLIEILQDQLESVTHVLNDVLTLQQLEDSAMQLQIREFNIQSMVENLIYGVLPALHNKGLQYEIQFENEFVNSSFLSSLKITKLSPTSVKWGVCDIFADQFRLKQVMSNLISNAIKFSRQDSLIKIHVSILKNEEQATIIPPVVLKQCPEHLSWGVLKFEVKDEGIGMSQEEQSKLFQPYIQIRAADTQEGRGTGLGLSLCKQLVQLHGGDIHVQSQMNQGSCFYFMVPIRVSLLGQLPPSNLIGRTQSHPITTFSREFTEIEEESFASTSPLSYTNSSQSMSISPLLSTSQKISPVIVRHIHPSSSSSSFTTNQLLIKKRFVKALIVEDHVINRKLLHRLLKKIECDVTAVENGEECVNLMKNGICPFDVIFMDGQMPKKTGTEATYELRQMGVKVPIYAVTGNALADDVDSFLKVGATQVLTKPVKFDELEIIINKIRIHM